jgi:cytochrome c553
MPLIHFQQLMKFSLINLSLLGLSLISSPSFAQTSASNMNNRSLAATCANCHGTDAVVVPNSGMPAIGQLNKDEMLAKLMAYKSGAQQGTIMPQLAKGYTDEQLNTIASVLGKK